MPHSFPIWKIFAEMESWGNVFPISASKSIFWARKWQCLIPGQHWPKLDRFWQVCVHKLAYQMTLGMLYTACVPYNIHLFVFCRSAGAGPRTATRSPHVRWNGLCPHTMAAAIWHHHRQARHEVRQAKNSSAFAYTMNMTTTWRYAPARRHKLWIYTGVQLDIRMSLSASAYIFLQRLKFT